MRLKARRAEQEQERRDVAWLDSCKATRFDPMPYIQKQLGWTPWTGTDELPGQQQIVDAYILAIRQQYEKRDYELGLKQRHELTCWQPGRAIKNIIRVESGHTVGKTKLAAGIVNHFFDHFIPGITYTFAPTWDQVKHLLWKEISADRLEKNLPGRVLETCEIKHKPNHFATGRAASDAGGKGTERVQGQHEEHLLFVLDEAEGVAQFVFDAVKSMTSGGICIVLLLANPRTRTSRFHKLKSQSNVASFRISCINHPNVIQGREVVPGAVKRDYVLSMIEDHCRIVDRHNPDDFTFELPWELGVIYEPDSEFMFRVLGIAPANISDKNLIPVGRYEAAVKRGASMGDTTVARMGVDVARFGKDFGTVYVRHSDSVWCAGKLSKLDTIEYYQFVKKHALKLKDKGVTSLHIRLDGGGGFGGGVIDNLKRDEELIKAFPDFKTFECQFGGKPKDSEKFYDCITEWTADVAETLKGIAIIHPPNELQEDLCEREYEYRNVAGKSVKKLEEKDKFRKRMHRSPDDGDGFVLACVSDFLVKGKTLMWA